MEALFSVLQFSSTLLSLFLVPQECDLLHFDSFWLLQHCKGYYPAVSIFYVDFMFHCPEINLVNVDIKNMVVCDCVTVISIFGVSMLLQSDCLVDLLAKITTWCY